MSIAKPHQLILLKPPRKAQRSRSGNIAILGVFATISIVLIFQLIVQADRFVSNKRRYSAAVEAASLAGARDLSKIVIDDPHFGYIALSDSPPGTMTVSVRGQPMPVKSINTLLAGIRLNALLAKSLGNDKMAQLARTDFYAAQTTIKTLRVALLDALLPENVSRHLAKDADGKLISANRTVRAVFLKCLGESNSTSSNLRLSLQLGTLTDGGPTVTQAPTPKEAAQLRDDNLFGIFYKSCVDLPVDELSFSFLPVSATVSLAPLDSFKQIAGDGAGSVLLVTALSTNKDGLQLDASACSIPPAYQPPANHSALIVQFLSADLEYVTSLSDLIKDKSGYHPRIAPGTALGGDYPLEPGASIRELGSGQQASDFAAQALYDWIRSMSGAIPMSALESSIRDPFLKSTDKLTDPAYFFYYFVDRQGKLNRLASDRLIFNDDLVSENQLIGATTLLAGGRAVETKLQDQVRTLGAENGGRHGGEPLSLECMSQVEISAGLNPTFRSESIRAFDLDSHTETAVPTSVKLAVLIEFSNLATISKSAVDASSHNHNVSQ